MLPDEARLLFPATKDLVYLQHAGLSLLSVRTRDAVSEVARASSESPDWPAYHDDWEGLRSSLAAMIGVSADEVTLTRGTGHGVSIAARGVRWDPGDNVVSIRGEFPTNVFPWTVLGPYGVELRLADTVDGRIDPEAVFALVDARTRVVSLSWVQFWNGYRADLAVIGRECRRRGILFAVDAIQGLGALRLDAVAAHIDVLACGGSKWLLGPPGSGFCYVRAGIMDELLPPLVGGGTVNIVQGVPLEDQHEMKPNARRFEESAVSWFDIAALLAGVRLLEEAGLDEVESRVLGLARRLGDGLADRGFQMIEPWPRSVEESSGIVAIRPKTPAPEAVQRLADAGVTVRLLRDTVRFSTHFFNTEDELDRVLTIMEANVEA